MSTSEDARCQKEYLRTVYEPDTKGELPQHLIDIVFVHGLNPRSKPDFANATWTHKNGNFWPSKQLPKRVPSARILVFSYNSKVARDTNENGIQEHANNLLDRLSGARESRHADKNYNIPIIFIAHSLGGLVVKQALVIAKNDNTYINLRKATHGLVFFAVPHQGGHGAGLGTIAKNIVLSLTGDAKNDIVESLKSNSLFQENQAAIFKHQLEDYQIVSIYENKPTKLTKMWGKATTLVIVDKKSATLGLPGTREKLLTVNSNHAEVCQFEDDDDKLDPVKRAIGILADHAVAMQNETAANESRHDLQAQEYFQKFLHSLHFPEIESRQEQIDDAHKKTFQWIFDDSGDAVRPWYNFVEWLETGRGTYWISGKAGSGKSTLMSYICQHARTMDSLKAWAGRNEPKLLTPKFFFWSPGSLMQKTTVGLLRSLLYQVFREHPEVAPLPGRNEPLSDWTERRLVKVFKSITCDVPRSYRMCFFVDGLDEFSGDHGALVLMFLELVQDPNMKIVLSSRPDQKFDQAFGSGAMLKLQDLTKADIKMFVSDKLLSYPRVKLMAAQKPRSISEGTIYDLINNIVEKSDGVFLWVDLAVKDQIKGIDDEDSLEQLKERLRILPAGLEDLYAHMLTRIDKVHRKEAAWFLQIALSFLEDGKLENPSLLDYTLAVYERLDRDLGSPANFPSQDVINRCQPTRRRITTTCAGLLEVHHFDPSDCQATNPEQLRVMFLHRTVADFFTSSKQGKGFMSTNSSPDRNVYVVRAKVLVAKVRMLGFTPLSPKGHGTFIETIMEAASNAEYETGVTQTALCGYIDLAVSIEHRKREHVSESHWCTGIHDWAAYYPLSGWGRVWSDKRFSGAYAFRSTGNCLKEDNTSVSVPEGPIDYLGFAASCGLGPSIYEHMESLPANLRSRQAQYLLCCVISSPYIWYVPSRQILKVMNLACTLLKYGVNPNVPAFGSTLWGFFLAQMFQMKSYRNELYGHPFDLAEDAWSTVCKCFIDHGADTNGTLYVKSEHMVFRIDRSELSTLLNNSSLLEDVLEDDLYSECYYRFSLEMSVPTAIRYCEGNSPITTETLSMCMLNGALRHSKFTDITIGYLSRENPERNWETWVLSQQQSDRLVEAYEGSIVPREESDEVIRLARDKWERQVLSVCNEYSAGHFGRSSLNR